MKPTNQTSQPVLDTKSWAMLLTLGLIWGGAFFLGHIAVEVLPPFTLVLLRVSIAAFTLHIFLLFKGINFLDSHAQWKAYALLGLFNNVIPFALIFWGQTEIGAGLASIINATTPFWTALLASQITSDEGIKRTTLFGIILGIIGTIILISPRLSLGDDRPLWPLIAVLGATFSYAAAAIFAKRFKLSAPALTATGQLTASTLWMIPIVFLTGGYGAIAAMDAGIWLAVIVLAVLSTAYAYILYFSIIARAGATNASLVTLIVPVSAILLGIVFLGERLGLAEMVGLFVVTLGLLVIDGRILKRFSKPIL